MSNPAVDSLPLIARSQTVDDPGPLLELLPPEDAFAWLHGGDGLVGWGRVAEIEPVGEGRFAEASAWWKDLSARAVVRDPVQVPGSGLVAFASLSFGSHAQDSDDPNAGLGHSRLVVPEVVFGRRNGTSWVTVIGSGLQALPDAEPAPAPAPVESAEFSDGSIEQSRWPDVVAEAIKRIESGALDKVVLARDVIARFAEPLDVRWPLHRLSEAYPACWTFHVDGFFGATPEMLVRLERGLVTSRVLAGTIRRTGDDTHDLALAASLARSSKDLEEHEYAVRSVADALASHCKSMNVPESPFVLHLPNVMHLATDVTGVIAEPAAALDLLSALHPSAAVGGTPTAKAVRVIEELEGMDRGRYAGPVGWVSATGDGEFGIGLRSAQISRDGRSARLFAGCGIVSDSRPEAELAESNAKLEPVRSALQR